jgi:predicted RNA methylase
LHPRDVGSGDVFVDFGSGKGRVLCQAARYPFRRVIGIEIAEDLTEVARQNVEAQRPNWRCEEVELVTGDATTWVVPDDMTVAYFFNPFVGETFRRVHANILASLDRNPRRVRLIYALPVMDDVLVESGRWRRVRYVPIVLDEARFRLAVYESVADAPAALEPAEERTGSLVDSLSGRLRESVSGLRHASR